VQALALTDVTGYGILGHSYEMAAAGKVALRLSAGRVPLLPGALEYASRGIVTGGADRNRNHLQDKVSLSDEISKEVEHVLFDPQTSGGLLMAVAPEKAGDLEARFAAAELSVWQIGEVAKGQGVQVMP
jgi:selenide,water dikinase